MQSREDQACLPGPSVEELVEKVTTAVLEKLQNQHVYSNTGNGDLSLPATAPAVQGSVVAEAGNSSSPHEIVNIAVLVGISEQATTAAATVQGSIAAVVDSLAGSSVISDRLKTKIWSHEYVDFGLLSNNKKEYTSFHLCLSNDTPSSTGQPIIALEPNQKTMRINSIEMWITAFQIFVGVYTQKYPSEAPQLMKYSEIIRDLAVRGYNWRYCDENFRYLRQKDPTAYPWGSVHWELWIRSQPPRYIFTQLKKIDGESQLGFRVSKGYCWKYHKGLQCVGCNFKHSCPLCEKNHHMMSCQNFRPSKGKPVAANTTTPNTSKSKPS